MFTCTIRPEVFTLWRNLVKHNNENHYISIKPTTSKLEIQNLSTRTASTYDRNGLFLIYILFDINMLYLFDNSTVLFRLLPHWAYTSCREFERGCKYVEDSYAHRRNSRVFVKTGSSYSNKTEWNYKKNLENTLKRTFFFFLTTCYNHSNYYRLIIQSNTILNRKLRTFNHI